MSLHGFSGIIWKWWYSSTSLHPSWWTWEVLQRTNGRKSSNANVPSLKHQTLRRLHAITSSEAFQQKCLTYSNYWKHAREVSVLMGFFFLSFFPVKNLLPVFSLWSLFCCETFNLRNKGNMKGVLIHLKIYRLYVHYSDFEQAHLLNCKFFLSV